jgi:hypothetical protein
MDTDTFVIAYVHSPRELWWGLLRSLNPAGVTLRGVSLDSFDPWARGIARGEKGAIAASTVFFPMHRIEKIYEDDSSLAAPSHADRFRELTGLDARLELLQAPDAAH